MNLEDIVYKWLTQDNELTENDITDILEEKEDIVIALEIWEDLNYDEYTIDHIEQEVSHFRKTRPDSTNEYKYYDY
jgi:hypothetical protein